VNKALPPSVADAAPVTEKLGNNAEANEVSMFAAVIAVAVGAVLSTVAPPTVKPNQSLKARMLL
jgi:hypothetical protein